MNELRRESISLNFTTPYPLINAVISNSQAGIIFGHAIYQDVLFIIHKAGFAYLSKSNTADYGRILDFILLEKNIPNYFHIYDAPLQIVNECEGKKDIVNIRLRKRIQLKIQELKLKPDSVSLPPGYTIARIYKGNINKLRVFNLNLENKFWSSENDFLHNGFGFVLFKDDDCPVSICYSACVANNVAEIDVATLQEYQNRGMAKAVVAQFVKYCIENRVIANWDCFEDNIGSLRTAQSIGFEEVARYNFLSIFNKGKNHES